MIDIDDIRRRTAGHALVRGVDRIAAGHVRLETSFRYPDGSSIDLFLPDEPILFPERYLTDLGQTMAWLLDVQVKPWLSSKRAAFLEDAIRLYGVKQVGGELVRPLASLDEFIPGVVDIGQACLRVSDLIFTKRSALATAFREEVEEVVGDAGLPYETDQELAGRYGRPVRVDLLVRGPRVASALLGLSSGNQTTAHVTANEIFRRWYDLCVPERREQRVTVFDDRVDVYRADDLDRLRDVSNLVPLSDRQTLVDLLAA